ncbi:MAG: alpha/beta fold hydrolase [Balneolaceae bacterium]|nr:alpha/beta fold hydrolase [Balneolaceae bacterium]
MIRLISDSVHYHCTIHKSKPKFPYLLMMHGFMGSEKVFNPLIVHLKQFCNPVTIDLSGHGQTQTPDTDGILTAERQIKQLRSILDRLSFSNLFIYGYSMGGRLAFQLLANCPEYFRGAVIESAHCGIEDEFQRKERREQDELRAHQIEENFTSFVDNWLDLPLFKHTPPKAAELYEEVIRSQHPGMMARSLREFGAGTMPFICQDLPAELPVCLISGSLDQKYVQLQNKIAEEYPAWNHHIVDSAGHRVHADMPIEVAEIIKGAVNTVQNHPDL